MKAKVKGLSKAFVPIYNEFVDICNEHNLTFDSVNISTGETHESHKGLSFELNLAYGLEQEEADQIFMTFIKNHPECYISFNKPENTEIEKVLTRKSETVIKVDKGFKLERI